MPGLLEHVHEDQLFQDHVMGTSRSCDHPCPCSSPWVCLSFFLDQTKTKGRLLAKCQGKVQHQLRWGRRWASSHVPAWCHCSACEHQGRPQRHCRTPQLALVGLQEELHDRSRLHHRQTQWCPPHSTHGARETHSGSVSHCTPYSTRYTHSGRNSPQLYGRRTHPIDLDRLHHHHRRLHNHGLFHGDLLWSVRPPSCSLGPAPGRASPGLCSSPRWALVLVPAGAARASVQRGATSAIPALGSAASPCGQPACCRARRAGCSSPATSDRYAAGSHWSTCQSLQGIGLGCHIRKPCPTSWGACWKHRSSPHPPAGTIRPASKPCPSDWRSGWGPPQLLSSGASSWSYTGRSSFATRGSHLAHRWTKERSCPWSPRCRQLNSPLKT